MTKRSISGVLAILILAAAPVSVFAEATPVAVAATPSAAKATVDPRVDPNTIVCKGEDVTGSRLGAKKVCLTRQQWADMSRASRERLDDTQRMSRGFAHRP